MQIDSEHFQLTLSDSDDPELTSLYSDKEAIYNLSETRLYTGPMSNHYVFRIEKGGILIGEIRLQRIKWINCKAEISLYFAKPHRSKGFGKEAWTALVNFAFSRLNLHRLEAEVFEYNEAGKRLFESVGFIEEGRLREARFSNGKYFDIICYGLLKSEFSQ